MTQIHRVVLSKIQQILDRKPEQKFVWNDSTYEEIKNYLSIDERGQLGEELIADILSAHNEYEVVSSPVGN